MKRNARIGLSSNQISSGLAQGPLFMKSTMKAGRWINIFPWHERFGRSNVVESNL